MEELDDIVQLLYLAAGEKRACRLQLAGEPLPRIIHPYGIYRTSRNHIMLAAWQERGFTRAGAQAGYRNLALKRLLHAEVLDYHFTVRNDFNPNDGQYAEWVFHI